MLETARVFFEKFGCLSALRTILVHLRDGASTLLPDESLRDKLIPVDMFTLCLRVYVVHLLCLLSPIRQLRVDAKTLNLRLLKGHRK